MLILYLSNVDINQFLARISYHFLWIIEVLQHDSRNIFILSKRIYSTWIIEYIFWYNFAVHCLVTFSHWYLQLYLAVPWQIFCLLQHRLKLGWVIIDKIEQVKFLVKWICLSRTIYLNLEKIIVNKFRSIPFKRVIYPNVVLLERVLSLIYSWFTGSVLIKMYTFIHN